jgi:hypothetical protein
MLRASVKSAMTSRASPRDVAQRMAQARARRQTSDAFRRETFALPRDAARAKAREFFDAYPKQAYMTEVESWRELSDGRIEFTMRRLPTAD